MLRWLFVVGLFAGSCSNSERAENGDVPIDSLPKGSEAYYNALLEKDSTNPEIYFGRALRYEQLTQYAKAIEDLRTAARLAPDSGIYVYTLADLYIENEEPNIPLPDSRKAIDLLNGFYTTHPDDRQAFVELAEVLLTTKQYGTIHKAADEALQRNPYKSNAWFYKGMAYAFEGDTNKAVASLQSCLEISPEDFDAHYEVGVLLTNRSPRTALSYFNNAIRIDSTDLEAQYAKGVTLQYLERFNDAMEVYRHIVRVDRQFERAHYNMGFIWFETDTLDKAYRAFDRAVGVNPDYADAWYMRGLMSENLGNGREALADYTQTLKLDRSHRLAADGIDRLKNLQ